MPIGNLDVIRERAVQGWAWDRSTPLKRQMVRMLVDGVIVCEVEAGIYRPDLQDAGVGDGSHSFTALLPLELMDGDTHKVQAVFADGTDLFGSPIFTRLKRQIIEPIPKDETNYTYEIAICAIAKNEGPYFQEWINFHKRIGVNFFLIFDNDSTDDTRKVLESYERDDIVKCVAWPSQIDRPAQIAAYEMGISLLMGKAKWIAFIDLDEFIVPLREENLATVLSEFDDVGGLVMPWRVFGSSGERHYKQRPVLDRFIYRAPNDHPVNRCVKTIVRSAFIRSPGVHTPLLSEGTLVDEFRQIPGSISDPDVHPVPMAERLVLNHYFCKSWEEWEKKRDRGIATATSADPTYIRPDEHFFAHDRNEELDCRAIKFVR